MSRSERVIILITLLITFCPDLAFSNTSCIQSRLKKGKIVNRVIKAKPSKKCPRGTVPIFSAAINNGVAGEDGTIGIQGIAGAPGPKGDTGATGPQGVAGPQGPIGPKGVPGDTRITVEFALSASDSSPSKTATASCPNGTKVIGGHGGVVEGLGVATAKEIAISYSSVPILSNSFAVRAYETSAVTTSWQVLAVALCIPEN